MCSPESHITLGSLSVTWREGREAGRSLGPTSNARAKHKPDIQFTIKHSSPWQRKDGHGYNWEPAGENKLNRLIPEGMKI